MQRNVVATTDESLRAAYRAGRRDAWRLAMGVVAVLCWSGTLALGLAYAGFLQLGGDTSCEASPGESNYGTFGWSVVPPGPTCTFTEELNGFDEVRGPTPVMSIWLLVLLVGALVVVPLVRRWVFPPAPRWGDESDSPW